jgi:hypothetical protein
VNRAIKHQVPYNILGEFLEELKILNFQGTPCSIKLLEVLHDDVARKIRSDVSCLCV